MLDLKHGQSYQVLRSIFQKKNYRGNGTGLANLAPRKIRGVESNGMILLTETSEGKLYIVKPSADATPGDIVA